MTMSHLSLYLKSCLHLWVGFYLGICFLFGLPAFIFHATGVGFLLCLVSYFRLSSPDPSSAHALLGPDPRNFDGSPAHRAASRLGVIAHRACGIDAPENTIGAVENAKKNGAKCIEFDVSFTVDGKAVVFHDDTVDRVTQGRGRIDEMTFEESQKLDASHNHLLKDHFSPQKIPTVEEFVDKCLELDLNMIIDIKSWNTPEQTVEFITKLFERKPVLYSKAMVSTFYPHLAYLIRKKDEKIVMGMAWRPYFLSYEGYNDGIKSESKPRFDSLVYHVCAVLGDIILKWMFHEFLWYFIGLSAVLVHKDVLTMEYVQNWREKGIRVLAWTVNKTPQKIFVTNFLRCTILSDSMDSININEYSINNEETND